MLTSEQIADLTQLHALAARFPAEIVIIGAAALFCFLDLDRFTRHVDLVIALDLEDFAVFSASLKALGWNQKEGREHRWTGPSGSILDLMPAGPELRAAKEIVWPESQFAMSLVGFEHVFARSVAFSFSEGVQFKVAPPPVIALIKIVAYTENPSSREKDLQDLRLLLGRYEQNTDRIFSDDVFAAELEDFGDASAFLLGLDVGTMATNEDAGTVNSFLNTKQISTEDLLDLDRDDTRQRETLRFQLHLRAFEKGFTTASQRQKLPQE